MRFHVRRVLSGVVDHAQRWKSPLGLDSFRLTETVSIPILDAKYFHSVVEPPDGLKGSLGQVHLFSPHLVIQSPCRECRENSGRSYATMQTRWIQKNGATSFSKWFVGRRFGSVPPGADIAQKILTCEDPSDIGVDLDQLTPAGLSAVARAAAASKVTDKVFLQALVLKATDGMMELSPVDVCNIVESFSELKYCHSIELKSSVSQFMMNHLDSFSGDMLGHTLRSFANLDFYDDELLEHVLTYMASKADDFSAENIADVVYAFSKCGFCHPDLVLLVDKAGSLLLKEVLHDKGEALSSIIDAYSRVGCTESDVVEELISRVTSDPDAVSVNALAKTLTAAIRLGSEDQHMINNVITSVLQRMDYLDSSLLIDIIKALGGLGFRSDTLLDVVVGQVLPQRTHEISKNDLEDILSSLNKLGYYSRSLVSLMEEK